MGNAMTAYAHDRQRLQGLGDKVTDADYQMNNQMRLRAEEEARAEQAPTQTPAAKPAAPAKPATGSGFGGAVLDATGLGKLKKF